MNELLSPLMIVFQSEHQSFWCLVNVLQRMVHVCGLLLFSVTTVTTCTSYNLLLFITTSIKTIE